MALVKPKVIIVTGPTGSGKSSLAVEVAEILGGAIINADSLAFYRGLDIGTAKPSRDDMDRVAHYLFDILDPNDHFDAAAYMKLARPLVEELWVKGQVPFIVGGTGLYLRSLVQGLFDGPGRDEEFREHLKKLAKEGQNLYELLKEKDPESAKRINPHDRVRVERALEILHLTGESISVCHSRHVFDKPFETLVFIIDRNVSELDARLRIRVEQMFERGLLEEVRRLLCLGYSPELKPLQAIGYRECVAHLKGEISLSEALAAVYLRTRRLAKRQRTWFRGQMPEACLIKPDLQVLLSAAKNFLEDRQ